MFILRRFMLGAVLLTSALPAVAIPSLSDVMAQVKALVSSKKAEVVSPPTVKVAFLVIEGGLYDSAKIVKLLYKLRNDLAIRAVIIKIDSRGGASGTSDILFDEVSRLEKEKPVIVFVENSCCSAAYQLACAGSFIIAPRSAAVGSIGVITTVVKNKAIKFKNGNISGSTSIEVITSGKFKGVLHADSPDLTDEQRAYIQERMDEEYRFFCIDVAQARGLSLDEHEQWANGLVFGGVKALELGLIDKTGSYSDALEIALQLAKERFGVEGELELIDIDLNEKK